ncbi:hypothetical protein [Bacillus kexueae]|uniref:hypothetical protein n=1 Tax=Aeribacillus kexueae TaxID=2078952 RepID=UPI001FAF0165|nr:hypothetical protein [Bacillus kexueae]
MNRRKLMENLVQLVSGNRVMIRKRNQNNMMWMSLIGIASGALMYGMRRYQRRMNPSSDPFEQMLTNR